MGFPKKISQLPSSGVLLNTDIIPVVNNGVTCQTTLSNMSSIITGASWNLQNVLNEGTVGAPAPFTNNDSIGILPINSIILGTGNPFTPVDGTTSLLMGYTNGTVNIAGYKLGNDADWGAIKLSGENNHGSSRVDIHGGGITMNTVSGSVTSNSLHWSTYTNGGDESIIMGGIGGSVALTSSASTLTLEKDGNILIDGEGSLHYPTIGDVLAAKDTDGRIEWVAPPVYQTTKELSTADISTLNSVPVILIDPPGAGKFIQVNSVIVELTYGGAPITGQDNVELYTASASTFLSGTEEGIGGENGFLGIGQDYRVYVHIQGDGFVRENSPLIVTGGDAGDPDPTMGGSTSTIKFYINYSIITI